MNSTEKLKKFRKLYIMQNGREPGSVILGERAFSEVEGLRIKDTVLGMQVFIDADRPDRVEIGNLHGVISNG